MTNGKQEWWSPEYKFFGEFYMTGDNSLEGYLDERKMTIEERTKRDVNGIIALLGLGGCERILDIPCGYGRHSIRLATMGYKVVGSDINEDCLDIAMKDPSNLEVEVDFRLENMIDIKYNEEFDAVINMCYSFGFFEKDEDNFKVLQNFCRAIKPGGKFLMHTDVNIPRIQAGAYKEHEFRHLVGGGILEVEDKYNLMNRRMEGSWTIIKPDGTGQRKNYSVRVYEADEFCGLCIQAGFREATAFSSWEGALYNPYSEEIMFVAKK